MLLIAVAGGVRGRPLAAAARAPHDGADHAAGAAAGADRDPPARPRHRAGLRRRSAFTMLFFAGTLVEAADGAGGDVRGRRSRSCSRSRPALGVHVLKPYQVQRLTGLPQPLARPAATRPTTSPQSLIAIGSGQKTGRGVAHATQTSLHFLPENQTDFIFAVVGETYGFVGAALVLSLYALLIWRALADPDDGQEPLRDPDRRRDPRHADVPGVRERRDDDRDHADHRRARCR